MIVTVLEKGRKIEIEDVESIGFSLGGETTLSFNDGSVDVINIEQLVEVRHA